LLDFMGGAVVVCGLSFLLFHAATFPPIALFAVLFAIHCGEG
jgi:hypothetical protein